MEARREHECGSTSVKILSGSVVERLGAYSMHRDAYLQCSVVLMVSRIDQEHVVNQCTTVLFDGRVADIGVCVNDSAPWSLCTGQIGGV